MSFASKNTPITSPRVGFFFIDTGGSGTVKLTDLLASVGATLEDVNELWLQNAGEPGNAAQYTLNGELTATGEALQMYGRELVKLTNREQIDGLTISGPFNVQLFTGQQGTIV